jgi:hypothetical protein
LLHGTNKKGLSTDKSARQRLQQGVRRKSHFSLNLLAEMV